MVDADSVDGSEDVLELVEAGVDAGLIVTELEDDNEVVAVELKIGLATEELDEDDKLDAVLAATLLELLLEDAEVALATDELAELVSEKLAALEEAATELVVVPDEVDAVLTTEESDDPDGTDDDDDAEDPEGAAVELVDTATEDVDDPPTGTTTPVPVLDVVLADELLELEVVMDTGATTVLLVEAEELLETVALELEAEALLSEAETDDEVAVADELVPPVRTAECVCVATTVVPLAVSVQIVV